MLMGATNLEPWGRAVKRVIDRASACCSSRYAPSPFQSGNVAHDQGISKAGNRKGRTTGIELAWGSLTFEMQAQRHS
jgi:hypothetical protein